MNIQRSSRSCDSADTRCYLASGAGCVKWTTGHAGVNPWAPHGHNATSENNAPDKLGLSRTHKLATWNVRGLRQVGKLAIVEKELTRCRISVAGISETHWNEGGHFRIVDNNWVFFSGPKEGSRNGVALWVSRGLTKDVIRYRPVSDRIIWVTFDARPFCLHLVQIYAPTAEADNETIEYFYSQIEQTITQIPNREMLILLGD